MVEWATEAPCMEAWEAMEAIIEWVCMGSNRIKENSSLPIQTHPTSLT